MANKMYSITVCNGNAKKTFIELMTYEEAVEFCESNDWAICLEGGISWDLVIEEMK